MRAAGSSLVVIVVAAAAARVAVADDDHELAGIDADGDGDVDADDRALLGDGEQIAIEDESDADRARDSARAVTVVETRVARERTADLGEVLSRVQGIQVRRSGGLGSETRFSLDGLYDEQIRFFIDGISLPFAGWGTGVANVPVGLVQRIDVHRGVVPIAFGADALGGAIDLVTDPSWVSRVAASYEAGSFGTHRGTVLARARDRATGGVVGLAMFVDRARNDYTIDVEVADERGQVSEATVPRFHDGYTAAGITGELGVVELGVVRRAITRVHSTGYAKQLQHNTVMTVPYGEAAYGETSLGAVGDVVVGPADPHEATWSARVVAGAGRRRIDYRDVAGAVYDWYGHVVRPRSVLGEVGEPTDQRITERAVFARATLEHALGRHHRLRLALAPTAIWRGGDDFLDPNPAGRDPVSAERDLRQLVTGVEHELRVLDDRIENLAFAKHYAQWTAAEQVLPGFVFVAVDSQLQRFGLGDAIRWRATPWLTVKASYEWATRLPTVDEVFGDGVLLEANLELRPETSHNVNLGARVERDTRAGGIEVEANLFARLADHLIIPIGNDRYVRNQNVFAARILGAEAAAVWTAPGGWARLDASITVQDLRNASSQGTFGDFEGDRLPNRPWLFGAAGASVRRRGVVRRDDELTGFASSRYVREFYRGWESLGDPDSKQVIPSQLVHGVGVSYALRGLEAVVVTLEVHNVTDARVFDSFGVQRPGRALYAKLSGEL